MSPPSSRSLWVAERVLGPPAASAEGAVAEVQGVHERLGRAMSVVIGDAGFAATFARCVMNARAECPALAEVGPDALLDRLWACLGRLSPAAIRAIGVTLVARYFELMSRFVGPEVTLKLFYNAWPEALPSTLELLEKS